jgi:hypothetical protein
MITRGCIYHSLYTTYIYVSIQRKAASKQQQQQQRHDVIGMQVLQISEKNWFVKKKLQHPLFFFHR